MGPDVVAPAELLQVPLDLLMGQEAAQLGVEGEVREHHHFFGQVGPGGTRKSADSKLRQVQMTDHMVDNRSSDSLFGGPTRRKLTLRNRNKKKHPRRHKKQLKRSKVNRTGQSHEQQRIKQGFIKKIDEKRR